VRWFRRRRENNGHAAKVEASEALRGAEERTPKVDRTVRAADEAIRRADRFAREVERSLHLRGTT